MKLVIAEKPSVAKDLARVLPGKFAQHDGYWEGKEHLITWAIGHMLELGAPEDYNPNLSGWLISDLPIIPDEFLRKPRQGMTKQLRLIKKLAHRDDVTALINACDAAREGELIFREIEAYANVEKPSLRLWLQSMTREAIEGAFAELRPSEEFSGLAAAAYSRSEADWLIGINATRGITKRLKGRREKGVWSAGRVQTPTLALLVHRELKVLAHVPVPFWRLKSTFETNGHEYVARYQKARSGKDVEKIWEESDAKALLEACQGAKANVSEKVSKSTRKVPLLYNITGLQKAANSRFGMSARRTSNAAQRLYEGHKVLSYPRSDFTALPEDYGETVNNLLTLLSSADLGACFSDGSKHQEISEAASLILRDGRKNDARNFDNKNVGDHYAIIPTGIPEVVLGGDDAKVFDLVLRRFCAAFMGPSTWENVTRETVVPSADALFFTKSSRLTVPGWQAVDNVPKPSDVLPSLGVEPGKVAAGKVVHVDSAADQTPPPKRYTESSLLTAMERASDLDIEAWESIDDEEVLEALKGKGLGTAATRADIIEGLITKGYLHRSGKTLRATAKGITLIDFLERLQADFLAKAELTAEMESHLHQVEQGTMDSQVYMEEVRNSVRDVVSKLQRFDYPDLYKDEEPVGVCPKDGRPILEGLKGYRCSKEDEADWFQLKIKHVGKGAPVTLKEVSEELANKALELDGVVSSEADPKRTNATIAIQRDFRGPDEGFCTQLEALAEVIPDGILVEWKATMKDPEVCGYTVWKEFRGRYMNRPVVQKVLSEKESGILDGFVSSYGQAYAGKIRMGEEFKLDFEPVKGYKGSDDAGAVSPELISYEVDETSWIACPKCDGGSIVESSTHFECTGEGEADGCGLMMPRTVCQREMTRDDLGPYFLAGGATDWIEDFISRKGRPFKARLVRKPNGRHGFEFPPRAPRGKKKAKKD